LLYCKEYLLKEILNNKKVLDIEIFKNNFKDYLLKLPYDTKIKCFHNKKNKGKYISLDNIKSTFKE